MPIFPITFFGFTWDDKRTVMSEPEPRIAKIIESHGHFVHTFQYRF
jgi:hypothetical protein